MRTATRRDWWADDPTVAMCPVKTCGCPIQRTYRGTAQDGMLAHFRFVHPGRTFTMATPLAAAGGGRS